MDTMNIITQQIKSSISVKEAILSNPVLLGEIESAADMLIATYQKGNKVLLAGNGGSAADAQHIAGELVNKFYFDRPGLPAISLSTDTSVMTAISNDYGFEKLFERQLQAHGVKGDTFVGFTTSGNSINIINALSVCREKGIKSIILTGGTGGKTADLCDLCIKVPSEETPRIQESHILIGHILCCIVEERLFGHLKGLRM